MLLNIIFNKNTDLKILNLVFFEPFKNFILYKKYCGDINVTSLSMQGHLNMNF